MVNFVHSYPQLLPPMRKAAAFYMMVPGLALLSCKEKKKVMSAEVITTIAAPVAEKKDTALTIH